jgi:Ca2+/Na+ antiporter
MSVTPPPTLAQLVVGVVAHRDLAAESRPQVEAAVREFLLGLRAAYPELPVAVMSALAEGGDRWVAHCALDLGMKLIAPLPLPPVQYEADFSDAASRDEFAALCAKAQLRVLPHAAGAVGEDRDRQYARVGVFIASHCQLLLALWDGRPSEGMGGTADVVGFHLSGEMPGLPMDDVPPNLLAEDDSDLVFHLVCPRARDAETQPLRSRWLMRSGERPGSEAMPPAYQRLFGQLEEFNRNAASHATGIAREGVSLLGSAAASIVPSSASAIDHLFVHADWLAGHYQQRVRRSQWFLHLLAVLTGLVFLMYSEFERWGGYLALLLVLFAVGWGVARLADVREWHRRYLDYRVLAEGLRVQLYWVAAGVPAVDRVRFAYDSFLQKQDVELGWIRHVMRVASLVGVPQPNPGDAGLRWVIAEWVGDASSGQLGYFQQRVEDRERKFRHTEALGRASLWASLACALILVAGGGLLADGVARGLLVLMGVAALFAGVRQAYSHKLADKELIKQYRFMARVLAHAAQRLADARTPAQQRRVLEALGDAALQEHAEWILMHRERPLEHNRLG